MTCSPSSQALWPILELPPHFPELIDRYCSDDGYAQDQGANELLQKIKEIYEQRAKDLGIGGKSYDDLRENTVDAERQKQVCKVLGEHIQHLGNVPLPNEHRVRHKKWTTTELQTRQCKAEVYVKFNHPDIADFLAAARECAIHAAIGAVLAAVVFENPGAGLAIFKPLWIACMKQKGLELVSRQTRISLYSDKSCTDWG
jgi:hypothetical protein